MMTFLIWERRCVFKVLLWNGVKLSGGNLVLIVLVLASLLFEIIISWRILTLL